MAFSTQGPDAHDEPLAEINVTPFVDVVLVLLIIFMITAGVFDFGLEIDVPQTREIAASQKEYPFVNITADGKVFYNTEPIGVNDIADRIVADFHGEQGQTPGVFVRADKATPWEVISPIVEQCGAAKIAVQMVTKPLEHNPNRGAP
ncbi:MAG: biopolymer transporter ExbD [Acidobacteria bacterium]|nr:biopolymer transporter ExbD [Acidobacteriota bacterium]